MLGLVVLSEVARDEQQHRTGPARSEVGEGAAHVVGDELGAVDLPHPLGDGLERLADVVVRVPCGARADALGNHQQRRRVFPGLGDRAVRHLDARGVEAGHDRAHTDLLAARHARKAVGHGDREALLAHHEDRHALFAERVVHGTRGIAAHPGNALGLEGSCEAVDRLDLHASSSWGLTPSLGQPHVAQILIDEVAGQDLPALHGR